MKTVIAESHYVATPGQPTRIEIDVTNTADVIDGVTAIVDGMNLDWVRLERPVLTLFPDTVEHLGIVFDIPKDCPAGDYLIVVRILSTIAEDRQAIHDFWLTVGTIDGVDVALRPSIVTGGKQAVLDATITNTGNAAAGIEVTALEPTRAVDCRVDPSRFVLGPGAPAVLPIVLRGPRPWFGQPATRQIHITATVGDQVVERVATFHQKPRIPRGLVTALILAGIILLWALIFLWVIGELRTSKPSAKATGSDIQTGPENIPLGEIGGTVEGRVTAQTTQQGIPRITVAAYRITPPERQAAGVRSTGDAVCQPALPSPTRQEAACLTLIASAVTSDDGSFSVPSLIPGMYQLEYSADGYPKMWYAAEDRPGLADGDPDVKVDPAKPTSRLDVVMTGDDGKITGKVALPPGAEQSPLLVMATMVDTNAPVEGEAQPAVDDADTACPATACTAPDAQGNIELGPLPTPATYVVSVTGPGYETQLFEQTVGGGQQAVINTVNLVPKDGQLHGVVRDQNGPLGGVEVVARSGATVVRATTPTTGEVGTFQFDGLPTPATYVVTFERDGYDSQTKSLTVKAGDDTQMTDTVMTSGNGTVTGAAQSSDGLPLGGVNVEVIGDNFHGETSTLTTSSTDNPAGSFTMSGLPVPGEYTISLTGDTVQTETVSASFDAAGRQSVGTVTLLPVTSEVSGVVRAGGGGLGEVQVVLTDGDKSQITTSATNPAGKYAFANVAAGSYTLTFTRDGFVRQIVLVTVVAGVDTARDVSMVPA